MNCFKKIRKIIIQENLKEAMFLSLVIKIITYAY